jgi:IclR family pca regulon transcriptional regulator
MVHESCSVSVLDGDEVVYIARVPTRRIMTVAISVGTRLPAYATSMGRVLLGAQSEQWLDGYLERTELRPMTRRTITDPGRFRSTLHRVRSQGFALVDQELEEGLRSIAVPIRRPDGSVAAAMNLSAHVSRGSSDSIRRELLPALLDTAKILQTELSMAARDPGRTP